MKTVNSLERRLQDVQDALMTVATSRQYAEGQYTRKAEEQFGQLVRAQSIALNSCGSALYVMFRWLRHRWQMDHRTVLVQNNTFMATGAMALENGFKVALVDSRVDCPSMSYDSMVEAHKSLGKTAAVVCLTHVGGWIARDYLRIAQYCKANDLLLVEDCAHAVGLPEAGQLGYASAWSFYATKALPIGEGGMITTRDTGMAEFCHRFRQYGKRYLENGVVEYDQGMNLRMSEWDAAILSVQLEALPMIMDGRRRDARKLQAVAPCVLTGPTNFYKYPVRKVQGWKTVGHAYQRTDQLDVALYGSVLKPVDLTHSHVWAEDFMCLPIGEDLYHGMSEDDVRNYVRN